MIEDCAVREPLAAGASRFDAVLEKRNRPATAPIREYLLVVDAGAGTTDFALFKALTRIGEEKPNYALLRKSVRMCRIAGNEIDLILRPIVLQACGVDQQALSADDFAYAKMTLIAKFAKLSAIFLNSNPYLLNYARPLAEALVFPVCFQLKG